jgi:hypothetical protein
MEDDDLRRGFTNDLETTTDGREGTTKKYDNFINVAGEAGLLVDSYGLVIDNKRFTHTILPGKEGASDHVKFLMEVKDFYTVPKTSGELLYTARISAKQFFRNPSLPLGIIPSQFISRVNNVMADPRLCCSAMTVFDDSTMMVYKFLLTNQMFYAYYGRRPNLKSSWISSGPSQGDYASFVSIVPLLKRGSKDVLNTTEGPLNDFNILSIGFHYDPAHERHVVNWYIDGVNVLSINQLGYRLQEQYQVLDYGGHPYRVGTGSLRFGFGHFSFLDYQLPNNYNKEHVIKDESQRYPINRSSSGLVQLCPTNFYRETYPSFIGDHPEIIADRSFAIPIEESYENEGCRLFGQGMVTRISWISIIIRNNIGGIGLGAIRNGIGNVVDEESVSFDSFGSESKSFADSSGESKSTSTGGSRTIEKGMDGPRSSSTLPTQDQTSFRSKLGNQIRRQPKDHVSSFGTDKTISTINTGDSGDVTMRKHARYDSSIGDRPESDYSNKSFVSTNDDSSLESIIDDDSSSLESVVDDSCSLETLTPSGSKCIGSNDICWTCRKICKARCCGGKCGSKCCRLSSGISSTISTVTKDKTNRNRPTNAPSNKKPVQIARSLDRYS